VVETAGAHGSLGAATQLARREGRIVIAGMHEADETIPTRSAFLRDLTIRFSSSYRRRHFEHVLELLGQGRLDPSPMIDSVIGLDELPAVFARARAGAATGKLLINPA
jgi:threonine dehydrogenase-like Zn-dependent dehydrogenase